MAVVSKARIHRLEDRAFLDQRENVLRRPHVKRRRLDRDQDDIAGGNHHRRRGRLSCLGRLVERSKARWMYKRSCVYVWENQYMTRWSLSIPEETNLAVRTFLARKGGKKGDLSRFVDEAVRRRVLDLTVCQIKDRNARDDQQDILDLVDEEVDAARAGRS